MGAQVNTYAKRTGVAKNNAAIAAIAISLAKKEHDPMAKRALAMKAGFLKFKKKLIDKYGPRAKTIYYRELGQNNQTRN